MIKNGERFSIVNLLKEWTAYLLNFFSKMLQPIDC